jgi:aminomethyltransferase
VLGRGIALAFIDSAAGVGEGDEVGLEVRGRRLDARVVPLPFVAPGKADGGGGSA